jgi:hypothetical protein
LRTVFTGENAVFHQGAGVRVQVSESEA